MAAAVEARTGDTAARARRSSNLALGAFSPPGSALAASGGSPFAVSASSAVAGGPPRDASPGPGLKASPRLFDGSLASPLARRASTSSSTSSVPDVSISPIARSPRAESGSGLDRNRVESDGDSMISMDEGGEIEMVDVGSARRRYFRSAFFVLFVDAGFIVVAAHSPPETKLTVGLVLLCLAIILFAAGTAQPSSQGFVMMRANSKLAPPTSAVQQTTFFEPTEATKAWGQRVLSENEDRV